MYWKCFFYRDMDSLCIVFFGEVNIGEFLIGGSCSKLLIVSIEILLNGIFLFCLVLIFFSFLWIFIRVCELIIDILLIISILRCCSLYFNEFFFLFERGMYLCWLCIFDFFIGRFKVEWIVMFLILNVVVLVLVGVVRRIFIWKGFWFVFFNVWIILWYIVVNVWDFLILFFLFVWCLF